MLVQTVNTHAHTLTHDDDTVMLLQLHRSPKQAQWQCKQSYVESTEGQADTRLSSICIREPQQWTPWLCYVLSYLIFVDFGCWIPQIMLPLPQVYKQDHFFRKGEKTVMQSSMFCCPSFFLFHRRALKFQPIRCKVCQIR